MVIPFLVSAGRVDFATSEGHMAIGDVSREGVVDSARRPRLHRGGIARPFFSLVRWRLADRVRIPVEVQ